MKCKECPLNLLCWSGMLNMHGSDAYICYNCERFFVLKMLKFKRLHGFVCEQRSVYIRNYKQRLGPRRRKLLSVVIGAYGYIDDPVQLHKSMKVQLCNTCSEANLQRIRYRQGLHK